MSVLDRVASAWRSFVYGPNPDLSTRDAAGGLVYGGPRTMAQWPRYDLDGQVARAFRLAVVQACIDAIARDVSAAPLRVYREVDGQPTEEATHPARVVIRDPNPAMSEAEFWYFVVAMATATGFCVVEKVRSGAGRPVELWPLVSPWLKIKPKSQSLPDWEYRVPGNDPWPLAAEDVILVTYRPDPWGGWTGRSPLTSLKRELAIDDQMTDFLNLLLERGGVPPIGLKVLPQDGKVPKIPQAEADLIIERFAQKYGGAGNWGKPVFLGGLAVERIGFDLGEMLFPQVREHIELHVCTAFGVPAGMIGTAAGLARNTYSNAETDLRKYYDGTIAPLWARLDGAFTRGLLREFDPAGTLQMDFDVSDIKALEEDAAPKWDRAIRGVGAGMLTLDDGRIQVGLQPFPNGAGDVLLIPFSASITKPADLAVLAGQTAEPPQLVPAALAPFAEGEGEPEEDEGEPIGEPGDNQRMVFSVRAQTRHGIGWQASPATRSRIAARSKKDIARVARLGAPRLRTFWKNQGERIVALATRSSVVPQTRDLTEVDWDEEQEALAAVMRKMYDLTGQVAFERVSDQVGVSLAWDLSHPHVRQVMNRLGMQIVGINETTRRDVQRIVADWAADGAPVDDLAGRLRGLFTENYKSRSVNVARTEAMRGMNYASAEGYRQTGVVVAVELLDNEGHTESYGAADGWSCAERNGQVVGLDMADFHTDSEHPRGSLAVAPVLSRPLGDE